VLTFESTCGSAAFTKWAEEYPTVKRDLRSRGRHVHVVREKNPSWFDVLVTDNLFANIITESRG